MYSPILGSFLSRDPLAQNDEPDILYDNNWFGDRLTLMRNLYAYASGNPTNRVDPSGLTAIASNRGSCDCGNDQARPKKKKYCLYDYKKRSGTAEQCLGYVPGDVFCAVCPVTRVCPKENAIEYEENDTKCKIEFTRQKVGCGACPAKGKDINGDPVASETSS